jgi:hypothetical protein
MTSASTSLQRQVLDGWVVGLLQRQRAVGLGDHLAPRLNDDVLAGRRDGNRVVGAGDQTLLGGHESPWAIATSTISIAIGAMIESIAVCDHREGHRSTARI